MTEIDAEPVSGGGGGAVGGDVGGAAGVGPAIGTGPGSDPGSDPPPGNRPGTEVVDVVLTGSSPIGRNVTTVVVAPGSVLTVD